MRGRRTAGFTIVELLIVVVVIAILAAITIVAFNGVQNRAKTSAVQQSLAQAQKKVALWKAANNDQLPANLTDADSTLGASSWTYQRYDQNSEYCLSNTVSGVSLYTVSTKSGQYSTGQCSDPAAIDGVGTPLAYVTTRGQTIALSSSLTGTPDVTLYAVVDVIDRSTGWNVIARLAPATATLQLDTGDVNVDSLRYRIDTSASTNLNDSKSGRTSGRHIGWVQVQNGLTNRQFNYDATAAASSLSVLPGSGFSFTGLSLGSATASTSPVATIVFNAAHDQATRARVMQWLANNNGMSVTY